MDLDRSLTTKQVVRLMHVLAAAAHYQRARFQREPSTDLLKRAEADAATCITLVQQVTGGLILDVEQVVTRMREQLTAWTADVPQRPFVQLAPARQQPAYNQAALTLQVIATASDLALPDALPTVTPLTGLPAMWRRLKHRYGCHGKHMTTEEAWQLSCTACEAVYRCAHGLYGVTATRVRA